MSGALAIEKLKTPADLPPVILITGTELYLIDRSTQKVIDVGVPEDMRDFNLDLFYGSDVSAARVIDAARSFPMMGDKRLVIVKDIEKMSVADLNTLAKYAANPNPAACLVMVERSRERRSKVMPKLQKTARVVECKALYENQVAGWLAEETRHAGYSITEEAASLLAMQVGTNLQDLMNELEKVYLYVGERRNIAVDDVSEVAGFRKEFTIFALQNAIGLKKLAEAQNVLRVLRLSHSVQAVIAQLTRFFVNLLVATGYQPGRDGDAELAKVTRTSPYFVRDLHKFKNIYQPYGLENALENLRHADFVLKTFPINEGRLMEQVILHIVREISAKSLPFAS